MDIPIDKYDITVGFFVFMGLLAVVCLTVFLAGPDLFEIGSIEAKTYLPSTYGLKRGVPVSYLELLVGHVRSVTLMDRADPNEQVEVIFTIRRRYVDVIRNHFQTSLEKEQLGGILSGNIILSPPVEGTDPGRPIATGDVLNYHKSESLFTDLSKFSNQLQEKVLPRITSILTEIDVFLARLNDPDGDTRIMMTKLRETAELLMSPDGELRNTLRLANEFATILVDRKNILMQLLYDEQLVPALKETMENMRQVSENGATIAGDAEDIVKNVKESSGSASEVLNKNLPHVDKILHDFMEIQSSVLALIEEVRQIVQTVSDTSASLPAFMGDVQIQLRELEDITRAVKNIALIQWNLEDDSIKDPVLLKPLLLKPNQTPGAEKPEAEKE
ncbi:MAG: MlaD family protein [Planctomycetota bacterium]